MKSHPANRYIRSLSFLCVLSVSHGAAHAAAVVKSATGTSVTDAASWDGGSLPTADDVATWGAGSLGGALTYGSTSSPSWSGIDIQSATGAITLGTAGTNPLTLGASGITLAPGGVNLETTLSVTVGAVQNWTVASGRTFTTSSGGRTLAINNALTLNGDGIVFIGGTSGATILTGSANLKINSGRLAWGTQTGSSVTGYSGQFVLNSGGKLSINTSNTLPALTINGGTIGSFNGSTRTETGALTIGGDFTVGGGETSGVVGNISTGQINFTGNADLGGAARSVDSRISGGQGVIFSGVVSNGGITKTGSGILTLTGANTYTGATTVNTGGLAINQNALANSVSLTLANSGAALYLGQNGAGTHTINNLSGVAGTSIRSDFTLSGTNTSRSLTINQTADGEFAGTFVMGASRAFEIVKTGAATLTLSGAGGHTLGTTITAGTLKISGAGLLGGAAYTGAIANSGTLQFDSTTSQILSGTMTGTGTLLKSGAGILTLAGDASGFSGTVSVTGGRLVLGAGLGTAVSIGSGSAIGGTGTATGSLTTLAGSSIVLDGGTGFGTTFNGCMIAAPTYIEFSSSPVSGNAYDVVTYGAGGISGYGNLVPLARGTLDNDTVAQKVVFTSGAPGTRTWNAGDGVWNRFGILQNWAEDDKVFYQGDDVVFGSITADTVITLEGQLTPFSVKMQHAANSYTFAGTGGITGSATFEKSDAGLIIIANPNSHTGATLIDGGVFRIADGGSWGSGNIVNNATFEISRSVDLALPNAISGTGTLVKNGTGTLTLGGASGSFTGGNVSVNAGTLRIGGSETSTPVFDQAATRTLTVNAGATLEFIYRNAFGTIPSVPTTSVVIDGGTVKGSGGASGSVTILQNPVLKNGATLEATKSYNPYGTYQLQGTVTVEGASASQITAVDGLVTVGNGTDNTGVTTFQITDAAAGAAPDLAVSAVIRNSGNNGANAGGLTKIGTGTLLLTAASTYTGATSVNAGTLVVGGSLANTAVSVADGATLGGNGALGGSLTIQSGGRHALAVAATPAGQATRVITGALMLDAGNVLDLTAATAPADGTYVLATANGGITGTPTLVNLPSGVTGSVAVKGNNLELTVGSGDYSTWASAFAGFTDTDPAHDPDGDGLTNFEEYAFGLDPTKGSGVSPVTAPDKSAGTFTYTRRKLSLTGLGYSYWSSTTLGGWDLFTPVSEATNSGDPVEIVTVTLPPTLLAEPNLFLRVKVANP
jgi:fibronectin-binding autotransporter adhesin